MGADSLYAKYIKRFLDLTIGLVLLVIASPVFLIISICIIASSGLPVIYKQKRIGKNGEEFVILKFRTMVNGADKSGTSTAANDSRITGIGKILRKTSLDELPQLINVIRGDMSLVGFRPDVPREGTDFTQKKWMVRPGITGYAQVNGRSNIGSLERLRMFENLYSEEVSFKNDLKTMLKTIKIVFKSDGTN